MSHHIPEQVAMSGTNFVGSGFHLSPARRRYGTDWANSSKLCFKVVLIGEDERVTGKAELGNQTFVELGAHDLLELLRGRLQYEQSDEAFLEFREVFL